jgi:hypothetical protein
MHELVHGAYHSVFLSWVCLHALSIAICSRSRSRLGRPARSFNVFRCFPRMWDVQDELRTQISVSVSLSHAVLSEHIALN